MLPAKVRERPLARYQPVALYRGARRCRYAELRAPGLTKPDQRPAAARNRSRIGIRQRLAILAASVGLGSGFATNVAVLGVARIAPGTAGDRLRVLRAASSL